MTTSTPMTLTARLLTSAFLMLEIPIVDFFIKQLDPERNIGLWFGAFVGAWITQIIRPYVSARRAWTGFLVGLCAGIYWGGAWYASALSASADAGGGWRGFTIAIVSELFIRGVLVGMDYFSVSPGAAVDSTAGRADNIVKIVKAIKEIIKS